MNCSDAVDGSESGSTYSVSSVQWWYCFGGAALCLVLSGLASGVNIGLMSISPLSLQLLVDAAPADKRRDPLLRLQARRAAKVLPLVSRRHIVLVTLLLTTAIADEVLPLCIDAIAPTWVAVVVSVATMLLFTEVLPTAIFTDHRNNLKLAAGLVPFVWCLIGVLGVLTYPMAAALGLFVEHTHKKVGDADSLAGSCRGDEEDKTESKENAEVKQLLKSSRFLGLVRLLRKEVLKGPEISEQGAPLSARKEMQLSAAQLMFMEHIVELHKYTLNDVMEPIERRCIRFEDFHAPCGDEAASTCSDWASFLCRYTALRGFSWFVVSGLHGSGTWDAFWVADVVAAAEHAVSLVDALLECSSDGRSDLLCVDSATRLIDAEVMHRHAVSASQIVLVRHEATSPVVGVLHLTDTIRHHAVPRQFWIVSSAPAQQSRRRSTQQAGDSSDDDVTALLNAPRIANAVPWSVKYASSNW